MYRLSSCISFESYIKPQPLGYSISKGSGCISFESYIKPQQVQDHLGEQNVVYLLNPTSNHNYCPTRPERAEVVYLLNPTSNHNSPILHQGVPQVVYLLNPTSNHNSQARLQEVLLLYIF